MKIKTIIDPDRDWREAQVNQACLIIKENLAHGDPENLRQLHSLLSKWKEEGSPLIHRDGCDYVLEDGQWVWIEARTLSAHIKAGDEGMSVTIYAVGYEMEDSITETWATYAEAGLDEEAK